MKVSDWLYALTALTLKATLQVRAEQDVEAATDQVWTLCRKGCRSCRESNHGPLIVHS